MENIFILSAEEILKNNYKLMIETENMLKNGQQIETYDGIKCKFCSSSKISFQCILFLYTENFVCVDCFLKGYSGCHKMAKITAQVAQNYYDNFNRYQKVMDQTHQHKIDMISWNTKMMQLRVNNSLNWFK